MKIRIKLLLFLFPPLLLSGLMINYLTGRAVCTTLHKDTAARIEAGAKRLIETSSPDFARPQENKLLPFLFSLSTDLNALRACFTDANGNILAHTDVTQLGRSLPGTYSRKFLTGAEGYEITEHYAGGFMTVYIPVAERKPETPEELALRGTRDAARNLGYLVVDVPLKDSIATEKDIARKSAVILAAVYAFILLTAFFLTGLALRPIRRLMDGTRRISLGDYGASIPVYTRDEFGDLARSFNEMSRTLSGTIVSKNYLDAIVDNMLDALVVTDLEGVIKRANRAAKASLGRGGLEGMGVLELFPWESRGPDGWLGQLRKKGELRDYEAVLAAGPGALIQTQVSASFIKDNAGASSGIVVIIRDVTFRKKYEAEMARSNEDLQRFAFVASHDLQEPLRTISNYIQLLESKYRTVLGPEAERHADFITGAVGRMRSLVRDLLEYSKIDAALNLKEVDSEEALDYVLAILQDSISSSGAVIRRGELPRLRADRGHLERLLQNLISNAIKFRGDAPPLVRVGAERGPGGWTFHVKDNGIGIDEKYGAKLFKLFGRLHGGGVDGAGIGLASCKKIVDYYGGKIWFESEPGKGSSFFFSIPAQHDAA